MKAKPYGFYKKLALGLLISGALLGTASATTLKLVPNGDLKILDPMFTTAYITRNHAYMVFDTLFAQDSKGDIKPEMIDKWSTSADGKKWSFTLRDKLMFSDGTPVTAEDCIASIERWAKKDSLGKAMMKAGAQFKAVDAKTFELTLNEPFGFVLDGFAKPSGYALFIMPKRLADTEPSVAIKEMVGSGPFLFKKDEWVPGSKAVYVKNPNYVPRAEPADGLAGGKVVKVDRVEWNYIPDGNTATAALMNGEVDMIEQVSPDFLPVLEGNKDITLSTSVSSEGLMVPNQLFPPFNNPKARQVLYYLVNQNEYLAAVGVPEKYRVKYCPSLYSCGSPYATDAGAAPFKNMDIEKAKELLKEAGYHGEKVVVLHPTDTVIAPATLVIAQNLKKAGVNVDVQSMDWATLSARRIKKDAPDKGGWNIFLTQAGYFDINNPLASPWLAAACGNSLPGWPCDKKLDELRTQFMQTSDAAKRKALAADIQVEAYQSVPYVMWGEYKQVFATRGLKDYTPMKSGIAVMWNVEKTK
ncbi:ABC transporter substrate-binding protein [Paralcaligenes ginsengisoli]